MMENIILLLGKKTYIVDIKQKKFNCEYGEINLEKIKRYGQKIKSRKGEIFYVAKPTLCDLLRKCSRMPQIVTTKDAAQILAVTGADHGWRCLDAGSGSGFLAIFIGYFVKPGHVFSYEKNKKFAENVTRNVRICGLKNVIIKNTDARKFTERDLDLVMLDMIHAEKIIKKSHKALKVGGWLVIYSPHIEQQKNTMKEIEKNGFIQIKTIENIQRRWQISDYTHPVPSQLVHTGFMTFARKIG